MNSTSIWSEELKNNFPSLDKDISIDVLIIGGGITGINTAYHLIDSGLSVCLVEKNNIGGGVTSKTTGKLTYLQDNMCSKIKMFHGLEKTKLYVDSQKEAIKLAVDIISKEKINCNLEKVKSYIFCSNETLKLREEERIYEDFGIKVDVSNTLPNDNKIMKNFYVDDTYVFHPIKYINSLANICNNRGISIFENTKITSIEEEDNIYICRTKNNVIRAKYVVLALHYPYFLSPFWMPFKCYLEKSYIEAFVVEKSYDFSAISIDEPIISMRYYNDIKNYQLYLSNSHNLAIKSNEEENFQDMINSYSTKPDYLWSNKDIMTIDSLPFIGRVNNGNLLIGTGYNTWGMTNGILAGKLLSDIILKRDNKYIDLFNPTRKLHASTILNASMIVGSNAYSFVKMKFSKNKSWYSNNVKFEKRNGKDVGIYIDSEKKEHIVYNICPHMKCNLIFNEVEKTWDCPCHGSRFSLDGKCIEGPSNYDITYRG